MQVPLLLTELRSRKLTAHLEPLLREVVRQLEAFQREEDEEEQDTGPVLRRVSSIHERGGI